ncbi:MAG: hypothetical protein GX951_00435 [Mollicutes bacterium]|nr:hypothetical protein [Mollicutes bacterium]
MKVLNDLLQELGISKVKLAKYLGVSRQMVYNYLSLESLDKWPKEKRLLLLQLLGINDDDSNEALAKIKVDTAYLLEVEKRLNSNLKKDGNIESSLDFSGLDKDAKILLADVIELLKDKLIVGGYTNNAIVRYLYYMLQSIDNIPEIKYMLAYIAKTNSFIKHDEFAFDENQQFIFEAILYSGLNIYNHGNPEKGKVAQLRRRFIKNIEQKNEERLSRTQQLIVNRSQALKELGYSEVTDENAAEILEKLAEIESRKI